MAEDEDLLDAIKEWEDRCKEAERQVASLMKAVDWMSQKIKVLESERDSANLQIDALTKAIQIAIPILGKGCKCDGCDCEMEMATSVLRDALNPKHESDER